MRESVIPESAASFTIASAVLEVAERSNFAALARTPMIVSNIFLSVVVRGFALLLSASLEDNFVNSADNDEVRTTKTLSSGKGWCPDLVAVLEFYRYNEDQAICF